MTETASSPAERKPSNAMFYVSLLLLIAGGIAAYIYVENWKPKTVDVAIIVSNDTYWDLVIEGAKDAAKENHARLTIKRSSGSQAEQERDVRQLLTDGIDGIGVSPLDPVAQKGLLDEIAAKSILVTFDSDAPDSKREAFVGANNYLAGWICGDEIRNAIPDGGEVVICLGNISSMNGRDRRQGVIDNLLNRRYRETREVDPVDSNLKGDQYTVSTIIDRGKMDEAVSSAAQAVKDRPNLKCFAGLFAYNTPAILKGLEQSGAKGKVKVVGFDEADETQRGIEDGSVYSSILQNQYVCGYDTVRLLAEAARSDRTGGSLGRGHVRYLLCQVLNKESLPELRAAKRVRSLPQQ